MDTNLIAVGFDGSGDARRAARWAAGVARPLPGAGLDLVHAVTLPPIPAHPGDGSVAALLAGHEEQAREMLAAEQRELAPYGVPIRTFVRRWLPAETLIEHVAEHRSGLVVVGRHGRWSTHVLLGSVSAQVARETAAPAVVIRGEERTAPPRRVLLAADGSRPALRAATAIAHWFPEAEVVAIRIRESDDEPDLAALAAGLEAAGIDREHLELRVGSGDVAESLLALARDEAVDLVAAGRRGHSNWHDLLLGSVADKLLQLAPCPVLVAH